MPNFSNNPDIMQTQPIDEAEPTTSKQEGKEQMEISNTKTFQEAIRSGNLVEAAAWLENVKSDPKYDDRWLDHRSGELMNAYCDKGELDKASKYVGCAQTPEGCQGRREKIDRLRNQSS
jgi:hypothetical protein